MKCLMAEIRLTHTFGIMLSQCLAMVVHAEESYAAFEHDGQRYSASGTLIGPMNLSLQDKVVRLRELLGSGGAITRTDGASIRDVVLLRLTSESSGKLDTLIYRTESFEQMKVAIEEISEINAGGRVIIFGSHRRPLVSQREFNLPKKRELLDARERELNIQAQRLSEEAENLAALRSELEENRRNHKLDALRHEENVASLSERESRLERELVDLEAARRRDAESKSDLAKERQRDAAARLEWSDRHAREQRELDRRADEYAKRDSELTERELRVARRERAFVGVVRFPNGEAVPHVIVKLHRRSAPKDPIAQDKTRGNGVFVISDIPIEEFRRNPADFRFEVSGHAISFVAEVAGQPIVVVHKP